MIDTDQSGVIRALLAATFLIASTIGAAVVGLLIAGQRRRDAKRWHP